MKWTATEQYSDRALTLLFQRNGLELLLWRISIVLLLLLGMGLITVPTMLFFLNRGHLVGELHLLGLQFQAPENFEGVLLLPFPGILLTTIARSNIAGHVVEKLTFDMVKQKVILQGRQGLAITPWEVSYSFTEVDRIRVEANSIEDGKDSATIYLALKSGQEEVLTVADRSWGEQLARKVEWALKTSNAI